MNTVLLSILCIAIIAPVAYSGRAYCTYHLYNEGDSLGTVACSDGANGLMTRFGYQNVAPMWPYITAYSGASWNSPQCGKCVRVQGTKATAYLTVIDYCGPPTAGNDAHFDIAPPAFRELFGDEGVFGGWKDGITWDFAPSHMCRGNQGNTGGNPPPPPPPANNPPPSNNNQGGTTRCGRDWTDANNNCGRGCNHDGDCAGQGSCFKDLKGCGGNPPPPPPPPQNPPPPPPPSQSASSTRCGRDWSDANGKCGKPCQNDSPCGGERCFADLNMGPCGRATSDEEFNSFSSEENFVAEETFTDAAVADTEETFVDAAVADAAIADVAEEEYVDNYVDTAIADSENIDNSFDANFDAAVAADASMNTQQQQTQSEASSAMQGWMVAILVMFSITTVLLLAVIILAVFVVRKH